MTGHLARKRAAYQFEIQASKLFLSVEKRLAPFRYVVKDDVSDEELIAVVLVNSFDFYEYHLHRTKQNIDILIVQKHNAVLPVRVLDMATATAYETPKCPTSTRSHPSKPSHSESLFLISKLILGLDSANEELAQMHPRTRQRYLQRRDNYLTPHKGRPYAS